MRLTGYLQASIHVNKSSAVMTALTVSEYMSGVNEPSRCGHEKVFLNFRVLVNDTQPNMILNRSMRGLVTKTLLDVLIGSESRQILALRRHRYMSKHSSSVMIAVTDSRINVRVSTNHRFAATKMFFGTFVCMTITLNHLDW